MIIFSFSPICAESYGDTEEYNKLILDNGASIIVKYIPDSPVVTIQLGVLSGLSNEGEYASSGISHFLEHLLFKGSKDKNSDEIFANIRKMGGIVNGFTAMDSAGYYITVPNENFNEALELLVSMVMEPVFSDEEMVTERNVVFKEIEFGKDDPENRLQQLLFEEAYQASPYRYPIIGYKEIFGGLQREDIENYHRSAYTPERIVLGIAGGILPEAAFAAAEKELKKYKKGVLQVHSPPAEPEQTEERLTRASMDVSRGYIAIGFHSTSLFSEDLYPMDVLGALLGEGEDSRLYRTLVKDKELLYGVSCMNATPRYPGLFIIAGSGEPEKIEEARDEIFAVIDEIKKASTDEEELTRAKNMVAAGYIKAKEKTDSVVYYMTSSLLLAGDEYFYEKYLDNIKKVTAENVRDAAIHYLRRDNSTTVILSPANPSSGALTASEPYAEAFGEEMAILKNGLKVIAKKRTRVPLISAVIAFRGGLSAENPDDNGISNITSQMLLKGTRKRDESEIVSVFERTGGEVNSFSGMNSMGISMVVLPDDIDAGLDVLADVVKDPVFPEKEIEKLKKKIIASIKEQEKDIFQSGIFRLRQLLYGGHQYAMREEGIVRSVENIRRNAVKKFYKKYFSSHETVLTIVGDIEPREAIEKVRKRFKDWSGRRDEISPGKIKPLPGPIEEELVMEKEQALVLLGYQGLGLDDDKRYILSVVSTMLSGGGGLLFRSVREDKGLAYSVGAFDRPAVGAGYFVIYINTSDRNIDEVRNTAFATVEKIRSGEISEEEVVSSKNKLLTLYASSLETNLELAVLMSLNELYGLGFDDYKNYPEKIKNITREELIDCAKEILDPDKCAVVIIRSGIVDRES